MGGLAEEVLDLIKEGFATESAPDGSGWAPKVGGGRILAGPTGNLKGGWHLKALSGDALTVGPSVWYAAVHQGGATVTAKNPSGYLRFQIGGRWARKRQVEIPARPMVPDGSLPSRWQQQLQEAAEEMLAELLR